MIKELYLQKKSVRALCPRSREDVPRVSVFKYLCSVWCKLFIASLEPTA